MKILAFDTSNNPMSVALFVDGKLYEEVTTLIRKNHTLQLIPTINSVLKHASLSFTSIDRLIVAVGPGSYTGLRIAVTTAKTLSSCKKIPLETVSSLQSLATNVSFLEGKYISPIFDARNNNIYTGLYKIENGRPINKFKDRHIYLDNWINFLMEKEIQNVYFMGELEHLKENILNLFSTANFVNGILNVPQAKNMLKISSEENIVKDVDALVPNYLRLSPAEANWMKEHKEDQTNYVEEI